MTPFSTAFATELANDAHAGLARCVAIGLETPVYRTLWNAPVTFGGITYEPDHFDFGEVSVEALPASPSLSFSIQNLRDPVTDDERPWSLALAGEDMTGVTVTLRVVSTSLLNDANAVIEQEWSVLRQPSLRGNFCVMELGPPADVARLWLPWPQIRSKRCSHEYKDGLCKSESTLATCPTKDLAACLARHPAAALRISQLPHDNDMRRRD